MSSHPRCPCFRLPSRRLHGCPSGARLERGRWPPLAAPRSLRESALRERALVLQVWPVPTRPHVLTPHVLTPCVSTRPQGRPVAAATPAAAAQPLAEPRAVERPTGALRATERRCVQPEQLGTQRPAEPAPILPARRRLGHCGPRGCPRSSGLLVCVASPRQVFAKRNR